MTLYSPLMSQISVSKLEDYLKSELHRKEHFSLQPIFLTVLELNILSRIKRYTEESFTSNILELHISERVSFLLSQFSELCTLNYYPRFQHKNTSYPTYPDDIDDTFSAWYAIYMYEKNLITPQHISALLASLQDIRDLTNYNLFNTWYTSEKKDSKNFDRWHSIDPIALSAIAAFFQAIQVPGDVLISFVYDSLIDFKDIDNPLPTSEFYHSFPMALYLGSRITFNEERSITLIKLALRILENRDILPPTDQALLQSAIYHIHAENGGKLDICDLEPDRETSEDILPDLSTAKSNPLYIESVKEEVFCFRSSEYVDSLIQFERHFSRQYINEGRHKKFEGMESSDVDIQCAEYIREQLTFPFLNENQREELIREIIQSADFQIVKDLVLLKSITYLSDDSDKDTDYIVYIHSHLLGLFAYHLYDKIFDNELPISNLPFLITLYRKYLHSYSKITSQESILSETDSFYSLPDPKEYRDHYKKSIGICIIPILIYPAYKDELIRFFTHYQLARQLADDLKDFESDLAKEKYTTMYSFRDPQNPNGIVTPAVFNAIEVELEEAKMSIEHLENEIQKMLLRYLEVFEQKIAHCRFELAVLEGMRNKHHKTCFTSNSALP